MKTQRIVNIISKVFISFSILSLGYVSLLSIFNPQATMALVGVELPNNDAISSIRGIYGGVGLVIVITLIYLLLKDIAKALVFLTLFWGAYAGSRLITIMVDGTLGDFGSQWLLIEGTFFIMGFTLFMLQKRFAAQSAPLAGMV